MRHVRNRDNSRWSFGVIDAAVLPAANPRDGARQGRLFAARHAGLSVC